METKIHIECDDIMLEGMLNKNSISKAVIVCHPHPLYGGDMDNHVVCCIAGSFFEKGYTTMRFNFRGAGKSTGVYDDCKGELDDVRAAISKLNKEGYDNITLAGYSFGARINAQVVSQGAEVEDHIMVSPPVAFMSFDDVSSLPSTSLIISGDSDEYAPPDMIKDHIKRWQISPKYEIIQGCDHFYSTKIERLKDLLMSYLK